MYFANYRDINIKFQELGENVGNEKVACDINVNVLFMSALLCGLTAVSVFMHFSPFFLCRLRIVSRL